MFAQRLSPPPTVVVSDSLHLAALDCQISSARVCCDLVGKRVAEKLPCRKCRSSVPSFDVEVMAGHRVRTDRTQPQTTREQQCGF